MRWACSLSLTLLLANPAVGMDRKAPWRDRAPEPLLTQLTAQQVHDAIVAGAGEREWKVADDKPGHLELMVEPRSHMLKVAVDYDTRQYAIRYVDSRELNYVEENGQRLLHPTAASWVDNLASAINIQLLRATPAE